MWRSLKGISHSRIPLPVVFRRRTATELQEITVEAPEGGKATVKGNLQEGIVRIFDEVACFLQAKVIYIVYKGDAGVFDKGFGCMIIVTAADLCRRA